jgi:hypothetical protein
LVNNSAQKRKKQRESTEEMKKSKERGDRKIRNFEINKKFLGVKN